MYWLARSGHAASDLLGRPVHEALESLVVGGARQWTSQDGAPVTQGRGSLFHLRHRLGHELPVMVRVLALRDGLGGSVGTAAVFHPAESLDALPHGECGEGAGVEASQAGLQDRLQTEFEDFLRGQLSFGVLWITVDQAHDLRKTHGANACEAMLKKVEYALANGLRPGEEVGRWGDDEFLVVSHERSPEMLAIHAQGLAGLARTAEFRWWGDRVSLTVSIGAAQADLGETLAELLERARGAMSSSIQEGGNHITSGPRRLACLPS
ncbi:MAG: diguanylate cyclase [Terracidiphilus sp.]